MLAEHKCPKHLIRRSEHSIEDVFSALATRHRRLDGVGGVFNRRIKTYWICGTTCVYCGLKGSFFAIEKNRRGKYRNWHLNLYAELPDGGVRLMTVDHVIPRSKGGSNGYDNRAPACARCNSKKSDMLVAEWLEHKDFTPSFYYVTAINWKSLFKWTHVVRRVRYILRYWRLPHIPKKKMKVRHTIPVLRNKNVRWMLSSKPTL